MSFRLGVSPEIFARFSGARVLVIYVDGLRNEPSGALSRNAQREAENFARLRYSDGKASADHLAAWRSAYSSFGAKPSKYLSSVEALTRRILRGETLPEINAAVDLYNALSVRHVLPVGGEDREQLRSDLWLKVAQGDEPFVTRAGETEKAEAGEVVWADAAGITCRRWNWRQGGRTALTLSTTRAYFVLECLPPFKTEDLLIAGNALAEALVRLSPDCSIEKELLASLQSAAGTP
jgi:DNA/RNA-binding domain of Phe-tRNA-synthetase-like protein